MPITLEDIQAFIYKGEVANYSALPPAASVPNSFYWVQASQGTKYIGVLWGGSYYPAGTYHSNGVSWEYKDTPSQATQSIVDAGTDTERYITSKLFNDSAQLASKASLTGVETLTNKRIAPRVVTALSSATLTFNVDTTDVHSHTAQAAVLTIAAPTGTPSDKEIYEITVSNNGTANTLTFNPIFVFDVLDPAPPNTVNGKALMFFFQWFPDYLHYKVIGWRFV